MDSGKPDGVVLAEAAWQIHSNRFYDKSRLVDDIASDIHSVPRSKVEKFVTRAAKGRPWFGFTSVEGSALAKTLTKLGVADFGYPMKTLIESEQQLVTAVLSTLHYGKYYYEGGASGAVSDLEGVYHLYLETTHNRVERENDGKVTIEGRLLFLTAGGRDVRGNPHPTKTNDNYVVEILRDGQSRELLARAGTLINAHPELIAVLSPFDFYSNLGLAEFYWGEWRELIDSAKPNIFNHVAAAETRRGLEILRFTATADPDGIAGSFQEGGKAVGTFYGAKIIKGVNDQVLQTGADLGLITPKDPALFQKIKRNLSGSGRSTPEAPAALPPQPPVQRYDEQEVLDGELTSLAAKPPEGSAGKKRNWLFMKRT